MIKKLLPAIALVLGAACGAGAAVFLDAGKPDANAHDASDHADSDTLENAEIVKLPSQFVIPVVMNKRVKAMMILNVALEVEQGRGDYIRSIEPKLRDLFLSELFAMAALGGFENEIISRKALELVRKSLTKKARDLLEDKTTNVLITDIIRQDVR